MSLETKHFYDFGDFRLDLAEKVLLRGGEIIPITPKVFETLCVLVESAGRLIEKDELMQKIWHERFVEEGNLTFNIKMLRKALGDSASEPRFIETVPKRGYRFVAEVRRVEAEDKKFEITNETMMPQSNGKSVAPVKFSHPLNRSETEVSGAVVGSSKWRRETIENEPEEFVPTTAPEKLNGQSAKLELVSAPPLVRKKRGGYFYVSIGLIGIFIAASFGYGLYRLNGAGSNPAAFSMSNVVRLTSTGKTKLAAVSPDGKFVAHVQQTGENQSLRLRQIAAEGETEIVAPARQKIRAVNFSLDGNLIYYIIAETNFRGTLFQTSALGGQPKRILENIYLPNLAVNGVGFAPDGKQIAFVRLSPPPNDTSFLMIADADGGEERTLLSYKRPDLLHGTPAWSPDGETIICPFQNASGMNAVAVKVADASAALVLPTELNAVSQIVWLPDGRDLLMVAEDDTETVLNQIYQVAYPGGARRRVNQDFNNYESVSLTADGRTIVAVRTEQIAHLWTMPADDASRLKQLTNGFEKYDGVNGLGWLANGKIVYESMPGGKHAILQIEPGGGGNPKKMATGGGYGAVSKDGRFLAYQKSGVKDGRLAQGLFLFDTIDGSERQLTSGWDAWATFAPDGRSINFIRWGEDEAMATLRSVPAAGGAPVHLTKFLAITAAASPDGKSIAVARWNGAKTQIVIVPATGGEPIKTFDVDFAIQDRFGRRSIQWTADGRAIDFIRESEGVSNIWQQSLDGGDPLPVTNFTADLIFNFAFSPDTAQLALSRGTVNSDVVLISNIR